MVAQTLIIGLCLCGGKEKRSVGIPLILWNSPLELLCISYHFFFFISFKLGLNVCWYQTQYEFQETFEN